MVRSETAGRQEASGGIFREHDSLFRSPEETGGTERYQVSGVNDPAEVRAERTADQVVGGIFREAEGPGAEGGTAEMSPADLSGPGDALPSDLQQSMGTSMGADFSNVRVHTGPGAARANEQLSARAFTRGKDVYFQSGEYDPGSREGQHLIAHELAHVAQDGGGIHREFTKDQLLKPKEVTEEQISELKVFIDQKIAQLTLDGDADKKIAAIKAKYLEHSAAVDDSAIQGDLASIDNWEALLRDGRTIYNALKRGAGDDQNGGATNHAVKRAYQEQEGRMKLAIEAFIQKTWDLIKDRHKVAKEETTAKEGGAVTEEVKQMLGDPAFKEFNKAVSSMQLLGKGFADVDKAAFQSAKENITLGKEGGDISLREKQEAMHFNVTRPDEESGAGKAARVLKAGGDAVNGVGESAGEIASTSTSHYGEAKKRDEKKTEKQAEAFKGATNSLVGAVGSGLSGFGDSMSAHDAKKRAELEDAKGAKAQKNMKNIGLQLKHTIPGVTAQRPNGQTGDDPQARSRLIRRVCDYVEQDKPSEKDSLTGLVDAALIEQPAAPATAPATSTATAPATAPATSTATAPATAPTAGLKPDLTERQKNLLLSLKTIEAGRSGSAAKAGRLKQESVFSSLDAVGNFMKAIGSLTSGISGFVDSIGGQVAGAVISAVGAIFGAASAMAREAKAPKVNEDGERAKRVETSRAFMGQMAALPAVDQTAWDDMYKIANPQQPSGGTAAPVPKISRENALNAEQYAAVFFGIQASNVELADLVFAIKRGGFQKAAQTGDEAAQKAEQDRLNREGMDVLYANLAFS